MAKLVRTLCSECGRPVRPKNKSSKVYVHTDYVQRAFDPRLSGADILAQRDHAVTSIKMETIQDAY